MKLGGDDRICFRDNDLINANLRALFEKVLKDAELDKGKAPALVAILGRGGIDCTEESKQASEFISVCTNDFVLNLTNSNCRTLYSAALKMYNDKDAEPAEKAPPKLNFALFIPNAKIDWSMFTNPIHDVYLKYKDAFEKGVKGLLADLELSKRKGEREEIEGTVEMLSPSELAALAIKVPTSYQVGFFIVLWKLYFGSKESSGRTTQAHDAVSSRIWEIAATMSDISFTRSTAEDGKDYCYSK
ncbi:hypothetical protein KKA47_05265, partial [bacterium]|nr:hypothetical protein [bacterium]